MSENVWPDFKIEAQLSSPKGVIEKLGAGLKEKTNGLVQFYSQGTVIKGDIVELPFSLYCPSLRYLYPFLRAKFSVQSFYPVVLVADKMDDVIANNEQELTTALAEIFNAPSTVQTIQKLMSLATETPTAAPF